MGGGWGGGSVSQPGCMINQIIFLRGHADQVHTIMYIHSEYMYIERQGG